MRSAPCTILDEFETARLRLRPLADDDESLYCGLYVDQPTMRFIGAPLTPERAERSFGAARRLLLRSPLRHVVFTMIERDTAKAIGICSLQQIDPGERTAEAGIMLHSDARGRGYSVEGLGALVDRAFDVLPVDQVWVQISADCGVVERLVISVGFTHFPHESADSAVSGKQLWRIHRTARISGKQAR